MRKKRKNLFDRKIIVVDLICKNLYNLKKDLYWVNVENGSRLSTMVSLSLTYKKVLMYIKA